MWESFGTSRQSLHSSTLLKEQKLLARSSYSFWIRMEEAPPPPLQMPASPYWPDFRLCTMWPTILAPDILTEEREIEGNSFFSTLGLKSHGVLQKCTEIKHGTVFKVGTRNLCQMLFGRKKQTVCDRYAVVIYDKWGWIKRTVEQ